MITLKTLPEATAQQVFDQVKAHLLEQMTKSITSQATCHYHLNDLRCAAGCLITEDEYKPEMEGNTWKKLVQRKLVPPNHQELITRLQIIHDDFPPEYWETLMDDMWLKYF